MEPVTMIVTALATGAGKAVQDAAADAVSGLYERLKAAVIGKSADASAASTLERHAKNPGGYEVPVTDLVAESGADQDATIIDLARSLLAEADPAGAQVGKYNVQVRDSQGTVIGDNATVTQTYN